MDITLYILDKDGYLECKRIGNPDNLIYAVEIENKEYTLTEPPFVYGNKYRWIDNKWVLEGE